MDKRIVYAYIKNGEVIGYSFKFSAEIEHDNNVEIIEMDKKEADEKFEKFFFRDKKECK